MRRVAWRGLLLATALLLASAGLARSPGVGVESGELTLRDGVYYLKARLDVVLSDVARDALDNGVPLVMAVEIAVTRQRPWYLWDQTVAERTHRYRLQFHALAERYMLTDLDSGDSRTFRDLDDLLADFGTLPALPVIDRGLLSREARYRVSLRAGLDLDALPRPLHTLAYVSSGWRLLSDWRGWELTP